MGGGIRRPCLLSFLLSFFPLEVPFPLVLRIAVTAKPLASTKHGATESRRREAEKYKSSSPSLIDFFFAALDDDGRDFCARPLDFTLFCFLFCCSMLPPKKRQQQGAQQHEVDPVASEASKKPEPSEEGDKATANTGQAEASIANVEPASIVVGSVETSKIRGTAPPREPRVGDEYQAELPQLVEQPQKR